MKKIKTFALTFLAVIGIGFAANQVVAQDDGEQEDNDMAEMQGKGKAVMECIKPLIKTRNEAIKSANQTQRSCVKAANKDKAVVKTCIETGKAARKQARETFRAGAKNCKPEKPATAQ